MGKLKIYVLFYKPTYLEDGHQNLLFKDKRIRKNNGDMYSFWGL